MHNFNSKEYKNQAFFKYALDMLNEIKKKINFSFSIIPIFSKIDQLKDTFDCIDICDSIDIEEIIEFGEETFAESAGEHQRCLFE